LFYCNESAPTSDRTPHSPKQKRITPLQILENVLRTGNTEKQTMVVVLQKGE
jgi:hypothetical protein